MSEAIIQMKNITKRFPGIVANSNVTLDVKKGEIYAILGENGAGKSTLMSMLFGMYEPDEGEIYIRGNKETIVNPAHAARLNIGMVHQHFKLVQNYTITENIVLGIEPVKKVMGIIPFLDLKEANNKIRELSQKYGLEVEPTEKIENVNVSTQQRAEILKMLYRDAEILIFDEPTAVLTPQEIDYLLKIIQNLRDGGKTIILITHKLEEIKQVADRCAILCRGKLVDVLDVATTDTRTMANLMVGRTVNFDTTKTVANFGEDVLSVKNLCIKNRDGFDVVKNASFTIRGGEIFAIAGVSGNGQIEIADAIAGLTKVQSGEIILNGTNITNYSVRKRTLEGISYIPEDRQSFGLVMDFTLAENLALKTYFKDSLCKNGVLNYAEMDKHSNKLIDEFDVRSGEGSKTVVRSMSGGNQQKAILAREIELESPLMIFVQPTRGLDIGAIENVRARIMQQRANGKAVLLVSLELDEIMACADTIGVIYSGEIQKIASANSLTIKQVGEFMMGVKTNEKK